MKPERLEESFARLYHAGIFTVKEYQRLDIKRIDKIIKLES